MNPMVSSATEGLTYTLDFLHKRPNHPTKQMQRNTLLINPPSTTPRNNQVLTTQFASLYMDRLVLLNVLCALPHFCSAFIPFYQRSFLYRCVSFALRATLDFFCIIYSSSLIFKSYNADFIYSARHSPMFASPAP